MNIEDGGERLITGYTRLAEYLTAEGFKISRSTLQKFGMPSCGQGPPIEGYWSNLPAFRPSRALAWARARVRPAPSRSASAPKSGSSVEKTPPPARAEHTETAEG
jgi:hypothetical protein